MITPGLLTAMARLSPREPIDGTAVRKFAGEKCGGEVVEQGAQLAQFEAQRLKFREH